MSTMPALALCGFITQRTTQWETDTQELQATAATITLKAEQRVWELPRLGSRGTATVAHC